jgi:hypothetical protein
VQLAERDRRPSRPAEVTLRPEPSVRGLELDSRVIEAILEVVLAGDLPVRRGVGPRLRHRAIVRDPETRGAPREMRVAEGGAGPSARWRRRRGRR